MRLLKNVPKRAKYLRACIYAHWKMKIQQDVSNREHLPGQPFWNNAHFRIQATQKEIEYFSQTVDVTAMLDVVDKETDEVFTEERWGDWIRELHTQYIEEIPNESFVADRAKRMREIVEQVPKDILDELKTQPTETYEAEDGELVALVQEEKDTVYARKKISPDGEIRYETVWLDALRIPHRTGESKVYMREEKKVAWWGNRIIGPQDASFPLAKGWVIGDKKVDLAKLGIKSYTRILTGRKFQPPTETEKAWDGRLGVKTAWRKVWGIRSFYASPRDQITWLKLHHRNLYVTGHDTRTDGMCSACTGKETQQHLVECSVLREEYWERVLNLLKNLGMDEPENIAAFLAIGRMDEKKVIPKDLSGIMFLAWRCIYAAIVKKRVENVTLNTDRAYERLLKMLDSRLKRYGHKWERWVQTADWQREARGIPNKHLQKTVIEHTVGGEWEIAQAIIDEIEKVKGEREAKAGTKAVKTTEHQRLPASDPTEDQQTTAGKGEEIRDMSGDAITTAEAAAAGPVVRAEYVITERVEMRLMVTKSHAQCSLATIRNLYRNEEYTAESLAKSCVLSDYRGDIRYPDWAALLQPLLRPNEHVKSFNVGRIIKENLKEVRMAACIPADRPKHIIALWKDEKPGFLRKYDNDSGQRKEGTYIRCETKDLQDRDTLYAIMPADSALSKSIRGSHITTLKRRRRRNSAELNA